MADLDFNAAFVTSAGGHGARPPHAPPPPPPHGSHWPHHPSSPSAGSASTIQVTPEMLEEGANFLTQCKDEHDGAISEIDHVVSGLLQYWRGEAQQSFTDSYNRKKSEFQRFAMDIGAFVRFLREFAAQMREEEHNAAGRASSLG